MKARQAILRRLLLWLLAGAAMNVIVAWACAMVLPLGKAIQDEEWPDDDDKAFHTWCQLNWPYSQESLQELNDARNARDQLRLWMQQRPGPAPSLLPSFIYVEQTRFRGFGIKFIEQTPCSSHKCLPCVKRVEAGWPLLAMSGALWSSPKGRGGNEFTNAQWAITLGKGGWTSAGREVATRFPRALPLKPKWSGFFVNTLAFSGLLWALFLGFIFLRRWRRARHGLCLRCAYPIGQSEHCTECGSIVRKRSDME